MATTNPSSSVAVVTLTPALFAELDKLARGVAGSALEVVPVEDMPNAVARVNYLMGSGYKDSRVTEGVCMMDLSIIQIANRISVPTVHGWTRPELDYSKIVPDDIYHFALWHEIGHRLNDLDKWKSMAASMRDHNLVRWLNEVRADRFAWHKLYPRKRIPRCPGAMPRRKIDGLMRRMERLYPSRHSAPKPLTAEAHQVIPASHVRHGIPWALDSAAVQ